MPFTIVRQDITKMNVDAIVNATNIGLQMGGGVCGAIFRAAGEEKLQSACDKLAPIKVGTAVITPGFALKANQIIHTAGPLYGRQSDTESEKYLRSAYTESLKLAYKNHCASVAFPLISAGIYGYPKDKALSVATEAIRDFLESHDMEVYLAVFDRESFLISSELMGSVESYIDEHYVQTHEIRRRSSDDYSHVKYDSAEICFASKAMESDVDDFINELDESVCDTILGLIDKKGKTDSYVYKKANIDRKLFSKIRIGKGYAPSKRTILALAIALELSLDETNRLLKCGGYALSHSQKFDVIIEYFIINREYDIYKINEVLFKYDQPLLGS